MPCKNCPHRWVDVEQGTSCHSCCEEYLMASHNCEIQRKLRYQDTLIPRFDINHSKHRTVNGNRKHSRFWL